MLRDENEELRKKLRDSVIEERQYDSFAFKNRQLEDELDALKQKLSIKE